MRDANGKRLRGKRSGSGADRERQRDIHSRIDGMPSGTHSNHALNTTSAVSQHAVNAAAKYRETYAYEETAETHVIPCKSLTRKQMLDVFPLQMEFAPVVSRQMDQRHFKRTGEVKLVEVTDQRLAWKSDRSLLAQGNAFADAEMGRGKGYKRDGSVSVGLNKRNTRTAIPNPAPVEPEITGIAAPDHITLDED